MKKKLLAIAALVTFSVHGCTSKSCTEMGCLSGASMILSVDTAFSNLVGAALEVCRNDVCLDGSFGDFPEPTTSRATGSLIAPDAATRSDYAPWMTANVSKDTTGFRIDIYYNVHGPSDVANGDRYHVRLVSAAGEVLADAEKTVDYSPFYPNGPDCDSQPCQRAGITF